MTTDAIKRVKEAEEKAKNIIESAKAEAMGLKKESEKQCENIFDETLKTAKKKAEDLKFSFRNEGEIIAKPVIEKSEKEVSLVKSVESSKLESVVNSIVERIVSMNGNS